MDSPPTSRLRFLDEAGVPLGSLTEWTAAWLELDIPLEPWHEPELLVNGRPLPVLRRRLAGRERVLVEWDRAGAGYYRLLLRHGGRRDEQTVRIAPWKLSPTAFASMLDEVEAALPVSIAIALQRGGALADLEPQLL